MKEKVEVEVSTNTFLKSFFDATYNENKLLFNNIKKPETEIINELF